MKVYIIILLLLWLIFRNMSWIKDFKELPNWTKSIVITFLSLIPLWIYTFFKFKPDILNNQWYVILSISIAISIGFFLLNLLNVFFQSQVLFNKDNTAFLITIYAQPILELFIIIFIAGFLGMTFKNIILIAYGINIWRCLVLGIFYLAEI